MVGYDFHYNGGSLRDNGFMMVKSDDDESFGLTRTIVKGTITPNKSSVPHFGTQYDDVLILHFFIVKNVQEDYENTKVDFNELRELQKWLTSPRLPCSLFVESYDQTDTVEYVGLFTDVTPFENDFLNGLKLTFTCDSQYAYESEKRKITCNNSDRGTLKTIFCDSDELNDVVYPTITVVPTKDGVFSITNEKTKETMQFTLSLAYSKYVIDCKLRRILGDGKPLNLFDVGWDVSLLLNQSIANADAFTLYWLALYPGANKLRFKGSATVIFEYKIPMKVGGYINV